MNLESVAGRIHDYFYDGWDLTLNNVINIAEISPIRDACTWCIYMDQNLRYKIDMEQIVE